MKKLQFTIYGIAALLALSAVYKNTRPKKQFGDLEFARTIVKVLNKDETGGGTGWSANSNLGKVIVTNDHVCSVESGGLVTLVTFSGERLFRRVLKRDFFRDLCLIEGVDIPSLPLADSAPAPFEHIKVMGHPLLKPTSPSYGQYITNGVVPIGKNSDAQGNCPDTSDKEETFFGVFCVQKMELSYTTVPIYPGNSGSPVINKEGKVIGVMNSADTQSNQGMFIPLLYVKAILNE